MLQNLNENYAGNLLEELEELKKMISNEEAVEVSGTSTELCNSFLTIYCC